MKKARHVSREPVGSLVFVVDDDRSMRTAIERLLRSSGLAVESFESGTEFLERGRADTVCCLVLDVKMPDLSGLDIHRLLRQSEVDLPIVYVTGHGDVPTSVQAMKLGAEDFLEKPFKAQTFIDAVRRALERDRQVREERLKRAEFEQLFESLTPREREVLKAVVRGLPNKLIALELGAAEKTIKKHRGRVMRKMQADSVAELVRMADRLGMGPSSPSATPPNRVRGPRTGSGRGR